jgi:hypothetical protein
MKQKQKQQIYVLLALVIIFIITLAEFVATKCRINKNENFALGSPFWSDRTPLASQSNDLSNDSNDSTTFKNELSSNDSTTFKNDLFDGNLLEYDRRVLPEGRVTKRDERCYGYTETDNRPGKKGKIISFPGKPQVGRNSCESFANCKWETNLQTGKQYCDETPQQLAVNHPVGRRWPPVPKWWNGSSYSHVPGIYTHEIDLGQ